MARETAIKTLLIFSILVVWKFFHHKSCLLFAGVWSIVLIFLSLSFMQSSLFYRRRFAEALFLSRSWLYRWLRGRWFVLLKATLLSLFASLALLMAVTQWSTVALLIMGADMVVLLFLYSRFLNYFANHAKKTAREIVARKSAVLINIVIVLPLLMLQFLYMKPPAYLDASLTATLKNALNVGADVQCHLVRELTLLFTLQDALTWWTATMTLDAIPAVTLRWVGWLMFAFVQLLYIWLYSRLILSATIALDGIFPTKDANE